MIEFQEQSYGYAEHYHANSHGTKQSAEAEAKAVAEGRIYLESGTNGNAPKFGGKGAEALGLSGSYDRTRFLAAVDGKYEINGKYVDVNYQASRKSRKAGATKDKDAYAFGEFVMSVNKSYSVALGMAKGDDRHLLKRIIDQAVSKAVNHMETLARVRVTKDGLTAWEAPVGLQWVEFDHMHNRRGDAHSHKHIAVMRHAMCADGKLRTLDMSIFMQAQHEIDAVMKSELARLSAEAGFELEMTSNGPELKLAPLALRKACSKGTEEIAAFLKTHGINFDGASHSQKDWANAMTKLAKVEFSESHIENITREKFASAGFDYDKFSVSPERAPYKLAPERTAREAIVLALEEIHERKDVIKSRFELAMFATRYRGWVGDIQDIRDEIDRMVETGYLVYRGNGTGLASRGAGKMTSQFAIEREKSAVDLYKRGVGKGNVISNSTTTEYFIQEMERSIQKRSGNAEALLSEGQVKMIRTALLSKDRIVAIEGDPGTGKTTGMEAIKKAAEAAGWTVFGFAPSDQARDALTSSGVKSTTVQFATRSKAYWKQINSKSLVIIDEAGMVDAGEMRLMLQMAEERGARVLLVGDRKQLQSVGAGVAYARIATYAKKADKLVELNDMNRARTVENKSLHLLSRDDQVAALAKLMRPGVAAGDRAVIRDNDEGKTFIDIVDNDDKLRTTVELDSAYSRELAGMSRGSVLTIADFERDNLTLTAADGIEKTVVMMDGGPAGKVFSSAIEQERYNYVADRYTDLDANARYRTPIIVDTNHDLHGVTAAIRERLGIKSVFEVQTFESRQLEKARHLSWTSYSVGDCIRITQNAEGFKKGELLRVQSVERDKLRVTMANGMERNFTPSRDGEFATIGEVEKCQLGVGDFVRFTAKWAEVGILNGDRGIVRAIDKTGKATVDIVDWDGTLRTTKDLELGKGPVAVRAGYAATVHALQGGTMDRGFYLASNTSRNSFLVGATRFRYGFTLIADVATKKKLEALAIRVQTHQHKESALPSVEDIAHQRHKPVMNAALPADESKLIGADGRVNLAPFPMLADMNKANLRLFLIDAKRVHGSSFIVHGHPRFIELAQQTARENPDLGVNVISVDRSNAKNKNTSLVVSFGQEGSTALHK